jgi:predicted dehydrogenase
MNNTQLHLTTRRDFLKTTSAAAAIGAISSASPNLFAGKGINDTIGVGCIGLGTRGGDLINAIAPTPGVKVVAVCDVYKPHLQKGIDRSLNPEVKPYTDYRDVLADKNVEAVVIATPDHLHCQMVLDAVKAGKDIYCEKGFAMTVAEAKRMRQAIKESNVVFQLGHHARQATCALQAKELIAKGLLGPITLVRTGRYGNLEPDKAIWRWYGYYSQFERPDPTKVVTELDWKRWLGASPEIPFNERHFWHWRCYWQYGTGQAGDLLSHEMDFVQYLLGYGIPDTCMCTGLNALLKDDREVPDTWSAIYEFEKRGCTVTFTSSMNTTVGQPVEICGKEATLRFDAIAHNVTGFDIIPEKFNQNPNLPKGYEKGKTPGQPNHLVDFFNCMRNRGLPKCNVDEAFIETATLAMSAESYRQKRMVRWDPVKEEIV